MNTPADIIAREVEKNGVLPFARFMELALYCPLYGYYEKEGDRIGRRGDFITSASIGSLFGELLAFQFAGWIEAGGGHEIVESGAHDGRLAADILGWLRLRRPTLLERIAYHIVEPSAARRARQENLLREFGDAVRWHSNLESLPAAGMDGVVFGNELLDAMPVRRFGWDASAGQWFEWGVAIEQGRFAWRRCPGSAADPPDLPADVLECLPDGYIWETSPAAERWWSAAAAKLRRGRLLAVDYGFTLEERLAPERREGTLRAYRAHRVSADVLADPGEQDLTAHVDFTAIRRAGETAGLRTDAWSGQDAFLVRIAERAWSDPERFGPWDSARTRQFQSLTHPDHLGRAFRVLIQSRGI
ncbi:MAG: SAM-dependent methyltransferase [Verrucomicrobiota bacterium]